MEYNIISGDGHIDVKWLPHDIFVSNAPAKWKDRVPRVVETEHGNRWFAEEVDLTTRPMGVLADMTVPSRGSSKRIDRMIESRFYEGGPHPVTPELRIGDQDMDGVDAEIIYPILAMGRILQDRELLRVVYQIYNDWAADFGKSNPQRLVALGCIANDSPESAASELGRIAELGLKGADLDVATAIIPIWHRAWDVLWAAADAYSIPISFHTSGFPVREPTDALMFDEYGKLYRATQATMFQVAGGEYLVSFLLSGAPERYPGMKFVLGEAGVAWIPYTLARTDEEYDNWLSYMNLPMKPSEYWYRQGYTTFQHETTVADVILQVGEDNIIWGSDYPHGDCVWPDSRGIIEQDLGRVNERVRRKITCGNAGKLYGLMK